MAARHRPRRIATQMVVERQLAAAGNVGRREMGREAFVKRIWEWKAESGGTITRQLRRLGASCDWSRERFTLDQGLSDAVKKVFVTLHKQGLIYRDKRLVNWDPQFQTAISDLEVEQREVEGAYWHFAYPLEDGSGEIVIATTRPETLLGDTAVAVHPDDERYRALVGKRVRLPIVGRLIPIVADEYADPEKGSGAVKITPAHDFNDFQVGKRHDLPLINIFDPFARLNDAVPAGVPGPGPLRGPQEGGRGDGSAWPAAADREDPPCGAPRRPLGRDDRALSDRSVVRRRLHSGPTGDQGRRGRQDGVRAQELGEDLLRVAAQHRALVHLAPAVVGPPHSRLVRPGRPCVRRGDRGRGDRRRPRPLRPERGADPGRGRTRHLVLLGPVAVFDPGLA